MVASVSIARCVSIQAEGSKHPWIVSEIQIVGGVEFVQIIMDNEPFCIFVSGTSKGCRYSTYVTELKQLRTPNTPRAAEDNLVSIVYQPRRVLNSPDTGPTVSTPRFGGRPGQGGQGSQAPSAPSGPSS